MEIALLLLMPLFCLSNDVQLKFAVIASLDCPLGCLNETIITTIINGKDIIRVQFLWKNVDNTKEHYSTLKWANTVDWKDVDGIFVASNFQKSSLNYLDSNSELPPLLNLELFSSNEMLAPASRKCYTAKEPPNSADYSTLYDDSPRMIASVIHSMDWRSTYIFVDEENEIKGNDVVYALSKYDISSILARVPDAENDTFISNFLSLVDNKIVRGISNITMICSVNCYQKVIGKPFEISRNRTWLWGMRHFTRWLIITDEHYNKCNYSTDLDNVVIMPTVAYTKQQIAQTVLHRTVKSVLGKDACISNTSSNQVKVFRKDTILNHVLRFGSLQIKPIVTPVLTLWWSKNMTRRLSIVAYVQRNGEITKCSTYFPNLKHGLNRRHFVVVTNTWAPFVSRADNNTYKGFCIDLLHHLSIGLNFTYSLVEPPDGGWGAPLPNGSWSGIVGVMKRFDADLAIAPLSASTQRKQQMDFSYPYFIDPTKFLVKKPSEDLFKWRTLIDPFSDMVLLGIALALPIMSFALCFLENVSPYYDTKEDRSNSRGLHYFSDSFWYMYGALLTQGGEHMTESTSGRTLLCFWWLFCLIMMATYSGNLIAFLTVSKPKLPFNSIPELLNQEEYQWGTVGGTVWTTSFEESSMDEFRRIWAGIVKFNKSDTGVLSTKLTDHINRVLNKKYVYIADKTYMETQMATECDLMMLDDEILPFEYSVGLVKGSVLLDIFSHQVLIIQESGLLQFWKVKHWPKKGFCSGSLLNEATAVNVVGLQSAFYLIGIGIVSAGLALLLEVIVTCRKKYKRRTKS